MLYLTWTFFALTVAAATTAAGHALLNKREPRAALGWIGFCLTFPLIGALSYFLFGINRIRTRARKLHGGDGAALLPATLPPPSDGDDVPPDLRELVRISDAVSRHALVAGNAVRMLRNGEAVYPEMLAAIDGAESSVLLASYIFDADASGQLFIDALGRAADRGVDVRVLLDGYGEIYSRPRAGKKLRRRGVKLALFIPPKLIPPTWHLNLRSHRKILAVDGRLVFVGGMNIGERHLAENLDNPARVVDLHFRLEGPIVTQIARVFCEDWEFATHETVPVPPPQSAAGDAHCRTITDGPNEDLDRLSTIMGAAIAAAQRRVLIMTPYFLPAREMIAALQAAALRGCEVTVILPRKNNLPYMHWATRNLLWELLQRGVRIYYQPPPFVHSKLFLIDDHYALVGSANIDPRSLRLNFELGVEVFDVELAREMAAHFEAVRDVSHEVTFTEIEGRPLPERLRDGAVWLFSPYL